MKRPFGVTIIMSMFLLTGFIAFNQLQKPHKPQFFALWVVNLVAGFGLGWALYFMQEWSRWVSIVACALSLVVVPPQLAVFRDRTYLIVAIACRVLFMVWAIWYLFRPHVKDAFQAGEGKVQPTY